MDPITMIAVANIAINLIIRLVTMIQENQSMTEEQKREVLAQLEVKLGETLVAVMALGPVTPVEPTEPA
jgi:hypothetical protein